MNITELQINTSNIAALKQFYTKTLDLKILNENENSISFKIGASNLTFVKSNSNEHPYYHYAINIPENQIQDAIEWLDSRVSLIEYENSPLIDFPNWNAHSVYFYDPAGNIVELIARHDLDNTSSTLFSEKSFLNISEVGMPVESVKEFHNIITDQLSEKLWWGNLDTFAAIGDKEGLFIVVTTQRNWFPTDKPCNVYPMSVNIKGLAKNSVNFSVYSIDPI